MTLPTIKNEYVYKLWKDLMKACYMSGKANKDVVAKEWQQYEKFEKWVLAQPCFKDDPPTSNGETSDGKPMLNGLVLTKDVLSDEPCYIYNKNTTTFVTPDVLVHLARLTEVNNYGLPVGIIKILGKRRWSVKVRHYQKTQYKMGVKSEEEAIQVRKEFLWNITKEMIEKQVDIRVVIALIQKFAY